LIEDVKSDEDRSFERQLIEIMPYLNRLAAKICGDRDHAQDLAQEALAKAWRGRVQFEPGTNFKAWLFTILNNEFRSEYRRSWRQVPWDQELAENTMISEEEQSSAAELQDVWRAMAKLPESQRNALIMVCADGMTYEKAASVNLCAVGTMKSRVVRARRALKSAIEVDMSTSESETGLGVAALAAMGSRRTVGVQRPAARP
jgi:RNA polymerase sigma-70 factor (ECF subfamily)